MARIVKRAGVSVLLFLGTSVIGPAHADAVSVGGQQIEFDPGEGYCALDPNASEPERLLIEWQRGANTGYNELLGIYVACSTVTRLRDGSASDLGRYGILLAPLTQGELRKMPSMSRAEFIAELGAAVGAGVDLDSDAIEARLNDTLHAISEGVGEIGLSGVEQLGVLHRTDTSLFTGLLMKVEADGQAQVMAGVSAATLAKGFMIQYSLYSPFIDESTILDLISDLEPVMADVASGNDASARPAGTVADEATDFLNRLNWNSIVGKAIVGGIVGGLIAGVWGIGRRLRREK